MQEEKIAQFLMLTQGSVAKIVIENCRAVSVEATISIYIPWLNLTRIKDSFSANSDSDISDRFLYNMPILPDYFVRRPELVQAVKNKFSEKPVVVCFGMRGVGKTLFAMDYFLERSNEYRHIFMFTDTTSESLKKTCDALVKNMALIEQEDEQTDSVQLLKGWMDEQGRIKRLKPTSEQKQMGDQNQVGDEKQASRQMGCLLIFDGLHDYSIAKNLIPSNAHVLITSLRAFTGLADVYVDVFTPVQANALCLNEENAKAMGFLPKALREGVESVYSFWRADLSCLHKECPSAISLLPRFSEGEHLEFDRKVLREFFQSCDEDFDFNESLRFLMRYSFVIASPKIVLVHILFKQFLRERFESWVDETGCSESAFKFVPRK